MKHLLLFFCGLLFASANKTLDLSGSWKFALDAQDLGLSAGPSTWNFPDIIQLPGTTAAQNKGTPLDIELNLEKPAMQHLHQKFSYIGPAWYQREIEIPLAWKDQDIILTLERVLWESRIWIDGQPHETPQNSLSAPHRYDLTSLVTPGKTHTLTIRVDNRLQVELGTLGHAYTQETQSIWNGIIGDLQLTALPKLRVSHLKTKHLPQENALLCQVEITNTTGKTQATELTLAATPNNQAPPSDELHSHNLQAAPGTNLHSLKIPLGQNPPLWSDNTPVTWTLTALLPDSPASTINFGLRTLTADGPNLLLNAQKTFLRGNLECAIFPQTGHPDMEGIQWEKIMQTSKDHGLNHLRFHSWCPPEAAFAAADRHGILLQVELPNWTFKMGKLPDVDAFFKREGARIIREYSHHPSFVLFSLGNELIGDLKAMDKLVNHFRTLAPDLLYTSTSYAFSPRGLSPGPSDDFFISQRTKSGWVRGQGFLNNTFPSTNSDYAPGLASVGIPLVTHEVGQYVVYPNLAEIPKYQNSPLEPTALKAIKADLTKKNLLKEAASFTRDSGKLAALLYKEDIERALRTKDLAGIQLLQLQDFPGQSTATVGLLDAFWDSKGLIMPKEFRQFCNPTVPLARLDKFVWENTETFAAKLELAHFGDTPLKDAAFHVGLVNEDYQFIAEQTFPARTYPIGNALPIGRFTAKLADITKATRLNLIVQVPGTTIKNTWPIWVYPSKVTPLAKPDFVTHNSVTPACLADLAAGKKVLLLPTAGAIKKSVSARFIPVFWSPLHFPNQPGTLGATIDTSHPLWENFPTDTHTNWQWWELIAESTAVNLLDVDRNIAAPFRFIDKFNQNTLPAAIFEAKVGPGRLLVCTLNVESSPTRIVARQLARALSRYAASPAFAPTGTLTPEQLQSLIGERNYSLTSSSEQPGYPAKLAGDDNFKTFWHSNWQNKTTYPISLTLDLFTPRNIVGLDYLPRQDMANGRIKNYHLESSTDGKDWQQVGENSYFRNETKQTSLTFPKPILARYLRLVAHSAHSEGQLAACAELTPRFGKDGDTRDLGIVPGFNDSE